MIRACRPFILSTFCILATLFWAEPAEAQSTLTEDRVKDFIEETSKITSGVNKGGTGRAVKFLEKHLHENSRYKSEMRFNVPGYPARETSLSLDKKDFIDNVKQGSDAVDNYEHKVRIRNISISSDGRKATVKTEVSEEGMMTINAEGREQDIPIIGSSTCDQIIMLNRANVIQMFNANCRTEITFKDY